MVAPIFALVAMAPVPAVLDQAIATAGGATRLERHGALEWQGQAVVHAGDDFTPVRALDQRLFNAPD